MSSSTAAKGHLMPSPIAHCSLAFLGWPMLRRRVHTTTTRLTRIVLFGAVIAGLMGPDFDLLAGPIMGVRFSVYHNGFTNSLLCAPVFGLLFAGLCRALVRQRFAFLWMFGTGLYLSHILLDLFTWGRGIQLFWPFTAERVQGPVILFRGVRHSIGAGLSEHVLTVLWDLTFALLVWIASIVVFRRQRCTARPDHGARRRATR